MRFLIVAALAALLCACATGRDANYSAYLEAHAAADARHDAHLASIGEAATACADDTCRVAVATLAEMASSADGGKAAPAQFVQQPSTAAKICLALVGQLGSLANAAVSWHQSDNAARTSEAQYRFLGGAVSDMAAVASGATTAAAGLAPDITVGGGHIAGDGNAHTARGSGTAARSTSVAARPAVTIIASSRRVRSTRATTGTIAPAKGARRPSRTRAAKRDHRDNPDDRGRARHGRRISLEPAVADPAEARRGH